MTEPTFDNHWRMFVGSVPRKQRIPTFPAWRKLTVVFTSIASFSKVLVATAPHRSALARFVHPTGIIASARLFGSEYDHVAATERMYATVLS
jgi:hypothetical protein